MDLQGNKYTNNRLKGCALEVDLEYAKGLQKLHNDYPSISDKLETEFTSLLIVCRWSYHWEMINCTIISIIIFFYKEFLSNIISFMRHSHKSFCYVNH